MNIAESIPKANSSSRRRKKWNQRNKYNVQAEKQNTSNSRKSTVIANHTIEK